MFSPFERMIAGRYLRARGQESFISVVVWFSLIGIAIGVATLIVVMSVMNGFREQLLDRILGLNGHIQVVGIGEPIYDYESMTVTISGIKGVVRAAPVVEGQSMVTNGGRAFGAVTRGMEVEGLKSLTALANGIVAGSLDDFGGRGVAVIGQRLAEKLRVGVGDNLTLISPARTNTPFGAAPLQKAFKIVALFDVGMFEYDSSFVYIPNKDARALFNTGEGVSLIEVMVTDPENLEAHKAAIRKVSRHQARVIDWRYTNGAFVNALKVERNVMFLILMLIILVAAFNIVSSLIMLVKDKTRDIAVMRAMGATRGMIMRVFVFTGTSIGVIGTLAGFALGMAFVMNIERIRRGLESLTGTDLFAAEIFFLSKLPAKVDNFEVGLVVLMALALSFLASLYPAWRAAKAEPASALRYE